MTPAQLEQLKLIDAHLERLLAIAEKRTPGKWILSSHTVPLGETGDFDGVIHIEAVECRQSDPVLCEFWNPDDEEEENFHFIASCAGNAEAGWKSTRAAIFALLEMHKFLDSVLVGSPVTNSIEIVQTALLPHILSAFPLELIQNP